MDSEDEEEFQARLETLSNVWSERLGVKGLEFHRWVLKNNAGSRTTAGRIRKAAQTLLQQ